jgi:hypothetical protein
LRGLIAVTVEAGVVGHLAPSQCARVRQNPTGGLAANLLTRDEVRRSKAEGLIGDLLTRAGCADFEPTR